MKTSGQSDTSVIVTVYNEESTIRNLIHSLLQQTQKPKEIIIVDGGSTDQTYQILKKNPKIKSFQRPGNRSVGRNFGVSKAKGSLIAFTDAGCLAHQDWLEKLISPFEDNAVSVVSGYYSGLSETIFQKCLIPYVLVMPDKAGKTEFYPATRSMAIRKNVFLKSGGFDENLFHNEDYAYAHKLKKMGVNFTFSPQAVVDWIPRKNLRQAAWMFIRFAMGDIQSGIIRPQIKPLLLRYLVFLYLLFLAFSWPFLWPIIIILSLVYILYAISKNYKYVRDLRAIYWLPLIQITCDISVLFGSLIGLLSKIWT